MAIGRLIAKALLEGRVVHVEGFGRFESSAPPAVLHEHDDHRIWTSPRPEVAFALDQTPPPPVAPDQKPEAGA